MTQKKLYTVLAAIFCWSCCIWGQVSDASASSENNTPEVWYVHFRINESSLDENYNNNKVALSQLTQRISEIISTQEYEISKISITGYASPDGPIRINQPLSEKRAEALRQYVLQHTNVPASLIEAYGAGENWKELRIMIEKSNLTQKEKILHIIDQSSMGEEPDKALKELPDNTYRVILEQYYPRLRNASTVQLLRKIKRPQTTAIVEKEKDVRQTDTIIQRQKPQPTSIPNSHIPFMGIKTNLAYWAMLITPNIELEWYFARQFSFSVEGVYRWYNDDLAKGSNFRVAYVSPELRYYLRDDKTWKGHYVGLYGQYGEYDIKFGDTGYQGRGRGLGLSYGYIFQFYQSKHWFFDLGISAGYNRLDFDSYYWFDPCNALKEHHSKNYWGPTKLKASILYRF